MKFTWSELLKPIGHLLSKMLRRLVVLLIFGLLCTIGMAAPAGRPVPGVMACLSAGCDLDSGPVCAVDDFGLTRTFENRCMADLAYCRFGIFYAVLKIGEC